MDSDPLPFCLARSLPFKYIMESGELKLNHWAYVDEFSRTN